MSLDAVIIGGGPAGSSAAIRLARTGRKVRLYEKSHFPRSKLCGGFLSPDGLSQLEELNLLPSLRRSGVVPLHRTVIVSQRGAVIESPLPAEALSISRDALDDLLLQEARRSGVDVHEGVDGLAHTTESPCTVIATGRMAFLREHRRKAADSFGIQALFQDVEGVTDQVELDLIESGYVGLARQANGVNLCALTTCETLQRWGPDLDKVIAHFAEENPMLRRHLKTASRTRAWVAVGPVRLGIRRLAHGSTFYIGDAACVVDPFSGEGMSIALYSSQLLLEALGQTGTPAEEAYAALWRKAFMPALRWDAAIRMVYGLSFVRESVLRALGWFPRGLNILTDLTRYRQITAKFAS